MNKELETEIRKYLNQVSALKSCNIKIKYSVSFYIEDINQTSTCLWFIKDNKRNFTRYCEYKIENECPSIMNFFMEANMKISDIEQLDIALNQISRLLNWENGELKYIREEHSL